MLHDWPALAGLSIAGLRAIELKPGWEPALQRFFEANPAYFEAVHGGPAGPDEAHEAMHSELPPGFHCAAHGLIGWLDAGGSETQDGAQASAELVAMAHVLSDFLAPRVWHIGLFIVETARHGRGDAQHLYAALEAWALAEGAAWLRLGVVAGNARAENFWQARGYVQTRLRTGIAMGQRVNDVRVMVKPLTGEPLDRYVAIIPRDRPEG